jgi:predicted phage baseplate assembly protein
MGSLDNPTTELNDCGCCEGISVETPSPLANRPGLSAIAYRVGTHSQFDETLLARLSSSNQGALSRLTTRDSDDFSIALLDAWATVGDVLTFYQERIANEAYLRTAAERLSVLELARLINYQLRPGVAASTYLAFTLEDAPGALGQAIATGTTAQIAPEPLPPIPIDVGIKVQSIPGPGELAQTFETVEKIEGHVEWNAIKPRLTQPQTIFSTAQSFIFSGAVNLKQGDRLLIFAGSNRPVKTIFKVTVDDKANTTRVDFVSTPSPLPEFMRPSGLDTGVVDEFLTKVELNENVTQQIISKSWRDEDLTAVIGVQGWNINELIANIRKQTSSSSSESGDGVFALRQQAAIFGHNAPLNSSLLKRDGTPLYGPDWDAGDGWEIWKNWPGNNYYTDADIYLDRSLAGITKDTWLVLERSTSTGPNRSVYSIDEVSEASITGFGMSAKSTGLRLAKPSGVRLNNNATDKPAAFKVRKTTVMLQSEPLPLAELPILDPLQPASVTTDGITLDGPYLGLKVGQRVILTGERYDLKGVVASEVLTLKEVLVEKGFTVITFNEALANSYVRNTVTINANVALATHGETVQETLGGGDATQAFQRFTLLQPPLTYVSSSDPSGGTSTLEVRVNDILWEEVPDFYGHEPEERIYVTRLSDDGKTTVIFGDGVTGARLPTGQENIKAKYRKGIGLGGLTKKDQLTQLMTRPFGVKGVTNPIPPAGAADREKLEDARRNAPLTVLTLDRVVSLQDYEDFTRSFSGIDKALATWTWFGEKRGVFVTVAGSNGAEIKEGGELFDHLLTAIRDAGDPLVPLQIKSFQPRLFRVGASLIVDPTFLSEKVIAAVEQELRDAFSFDRRTFGQPVHLSEVIAVIARVAGVIAVEVTQFFRSDQPIDPPPSHIAAAVPLPGDDGVLAAELLTLDPQPLKLEVAK